MDTQPQPSDINVALNSSEARAALAWLVAMGADEILLPEPRNAFLSPPPEIKTVPGAEDKPAPGPPQQVATSSSADEFASLAAAASNLEQLKDSFKLCDINGLQRSARSFCFVDADPRARVLILNDRPRTDEERDGGIFSGKQEVLLRAMLKAIGLGFPHQTEAEPVSLANMVPWRPPGNRNLIDIEISLCLPFVHKALEMLQPKLILALGSHPGKYLAAAAESVTQQRGKWLAANAGASEIPMLATFSLHELLQFPERKKLAWRDLQQFRERLDAL